MTSVNESDNKYVDYLSFPAFSWHRPEGPPHIWKVVEGRKKTPDGKTLRFSIQEVPKDLEDEVVDFMATHFVTEEVTCVDQGISKDPLALGEIRTFWRHVVSQGVSVIALTVNPDPNAKPIIAGVNVLTVVTADDKATSDSLTQYRAQAMRTTIGVQFKMTEKSDVLKKYGVDRYLGGYGVSVHPSLRGQGLGEELLRARNDIGRAYQIPVSETIFTGIASQILAVRVGFELLFQKKYSEILDDEGKVVFPSVTVEYMKVMGKRLY